VVFQPRRTGFEDKKDLVLGRGDLVAGRYRVEETLGQAAFSTALQCVDELATKESGGSSAPQVAGTKPLSVCLKVIKNNKDFFDQSLDEIKLLHYLNSSGDPDTHHVLHMYDFFYYKEHLFIVSELLRENLYEFGKFIREAEERPYFHLPNLKKIARQMLSALGFVHGLGLIHCDVKPENIVISSYSRCEVKLIDFGSSCFLTDTPTTYIQSRSYRAPEVILGLEYDGRIDVWSLGCVLAEMLTGYVLFQNDSVQTMLARIQGVLGPFPEESLGRAKDTARYMTPNNIVYERVRVELAELAVDNPAGLSLQELVDLEALAQDFSEVEGEEEDERELRWQALVAAAAHEARAIAEDHFRKQHEARVRGDEYRYLVVYPKHTSLRHRLHTSNRLFLDFVKSLLALDLGARSTAQEAMRHPWLYSSDEAEAAEAEATEARVQERAKAQAKAQRRGGSADPVQSPAAAADAAGSDGAATGRAARAHPRQSSRGQGQGQSSRGQGGDAPPCDAAYRKGALEEGERGVLEECPRKEVSRRPGGAATEAAGAGKGNGVDEPALGPALGSALGNGLVPKTPTSPLSA